MFVCGTSFAALNLKFVCYIVVLSMDFEEFKCEMDALEIDFSDVKRLAVAVSGGPDSMALCVLLAEWAKDSGVEVHALSVDHGLRAEAAQEAVQVGEWLRRVGCVQHHVLTWGHPSKTAIQEEARKARYDLMASYCAEHDIAHLFVGQHMDDQAETVLFRLAKGSGLDGLCGMQPVQVYSEALMVLRPLLAFSKDELMEICLKRRIDFLVDPSNENDDFARVRLRQARGVLEEEGLSAKRLSVTASRLLRARKALDILSGNVYEEVALGIDTKQIVFKIDLLCFQPDEIVLRCVLKAIEHFRPEADYAPRMEKVEALVYDLIRSQNRGEPFRKRTLGGVVFEVDDRKEIFRLSPE